MRDTQRSKVYAWEREHVPDWSSGRVLTLAECRTMVHRVWADYHPGRTPPTVKDGRGCRWAWGGRYTITLPRWSRRVPIVLHETAHSLTDNRHGPDFVRLFIELLVRYHQPDGRAELLRTARACRVKVGRASATLKPVRRRSKRPVFEQRPCRPHQWRRGRELSSTMTLRGYVVVYEASCTVCGATRPRPAVTRAA